MTTATLEPEVTEDEQQITTEENDPVGEQVEAILDDLAAVPLAAFAEKYAEVKEKSDLTESDRKMLAIHRQHKESVVSHRLAFSNKRAKTVAERHDCDFRAEINIAQLACHKETWVRALTSKGGDALAKRLLNIRTKTESVLRRVALPTDELVVKYDGEACDTRGFFVMKARATVKNTTDLLKGISRYRWMRSR